MIVSPNRRAVSRNSDAPTKLMMPDQPTPETAYPNLPEPAPVFGSFGLRDLLNTAFYYRRTGLRVALAVAVLGTLVALLLPASYTARARLLTLNAGVYDMQPGTTAVAPVPDPTAAVNAEMQLLASAELHRSIVQAELGAGASAEEIGRRVRRLESHLHISKIESANVIQLEYSDGSPDRAAQVLRSLLTAYFRQGADVLTSGRASFLTEQRNSMRAQLDKANEQIAAFEKQNGVVDVDEQISGAVDLDNRLHQAQQEAEAALEDNRKTALVLAQNANGVPKEIEIFSDNTEAAHAIGTMQASLLQLEAKRADLASRYMAGSPFIQQVDAQIAELRTAIAAQRGDLMTAKRTGYNAYHDTVQDRLVQAEAAMAGAAARRAVLNRQVAESGEKLKSLIAVSDTLARLKLQRDLLADTLKTYSGQLEQARVQQDQASTVGSTNVRIIEAPVAPSRRNNPPLLLIAAGLVSAVLIAAVAVFVLSSLRDTFLSPQEAERGLRLPVLCDLPTSSADTGPEPRRFGRLIAAISGLPANDGGKVILLLTPSVQDELDRTAHGLAAALERRNPGRVALLRLNEETGPIKDAMSNTTLPNGVTLLSVPVSLSRKYLTKLFDGLRAEYDQVVVAAPPSFSSFESLDISPFADLILLVLQAEQTRKPVAEEIVAQVNQMGTRIAGLVLTARRHLIPAWLYNRVLLRHAPSNPTA